VQRASFLEVLPTLKGVVEQATIVMSLVPPAAALPVARDVASHLSSRRSPLLYLDANAIDPKQVIEIGATIEANGGHCVDGSIVGSSADAAHCVLYLSGRERDRVAQLFAGSLATRSMGDRLGQASAFKLAYSGLLKGIAALAFEVAVAAEEQGFLEELLRVYRDLPTVMLFIERVLPSYIPHAARRAEELLAEARHHASLGLTAAMAEAAAGTIARVSHTDFGDLDQAPIDMSIEHMIRLIARDGSLRLG
jgi:3-hydroxyisobutyrate dehydrogenase-like beta-hydroxyacid dehydrogenase